MMAFVVGEIIKLHFYNRFIAIHDIFAVLKHKERIEEMMF